MSENALVVLEDEDGNTIAEVEITQEELKALEEKAEEENISVEEVMFNIFEQSIDQHNDKIDNKDSDNQNN